MVVKECHFQSKPETIHSKLLQNLENKEALPTYLTCSFFFFLPGHVVPLSPKESLTLSHHYVQKLGVP